MIGKRFSADPCTRYFTCVLLGLACGTEPAYESGSFERELTSNGVTRSYIVHVPPSVRASQPVPLVIVLHGAGSTANEMQVISGMDAVADRRGFLVAYPNALEGRWATYGTSEWFFGREDSLFVTDLMDSLASSYPVDLDRVYAAGFSNGGVFSHQLGCQLRGRLAAVASVAATLSALIEPLCNSQTVVPAVFFHGNDDEFFPWDGRTGFRAAEDMLRFWAAWSGCSSGRTITSLPDTADDGTTVARHDFSGCGASERISLFAIDGGGHSWPGSPLGPYPGLSRDIEASEEMVEFFFGIARQ